jgi:hypothetical protein
MRWPKEMGHIGESLFGQAGQGFRIDDEKFATA